MNEQVESCDLKMSLIVFYDQTNFLSDCNIFGPYYYNTQEVLNSWDHSCGYCVGSNLLAGSLFWDIGILKNHAEAACRRRVESVGHKRIGV